MLARPGGWNSGGACARFGEAHRRRLLPGGQGLELESKAGDPERDLCAEKRRGGLPVTCLGPWGLGLRVDLDRGLRWAGGMPAFCGL